AAVAVGVGVSILLFVVTMSRSVIRRLHDATHVHSKRQRSENLTEFLEANGSKIAILELEGAMFFGSADHLANEITRLADNGAQYVVLDMKRVKDLDITTARLLKQTCITLQSGDRMLGLSYLEPDGPLALAMREAGLFEIMDESLVFSDTDMALEFFEERLIAEYGDEAGESQHVDLREMPILQGLSDGEFDDFKDSVTRSTFETGQPLFEEGDEDRELFLITAGSADVVITLDGGRTKRLMTFSAGTVIGEMALLEGQPRSATVVARDRVECYRLSLDVFERLQANRPRIAVVLLSNLARLLSGRVRTANSMIRELEG
ncbi:MAG: cyclic nucleotide-binding domain-containing protein, partial [Nannocystaceae bacterium]